MEIWKKILIGFAALIGFVLIMNFVVMPSYVRHNTLVKVPNVIGLTYEEAKNKLDDAGLEGLEGDIRYDPSKPIGTVLDQNPPGEQTVKDGRRIYLIISGGEQLYDVPNLIGRTLREAKFILAQRNLVAQEVEFKPSVQYPAGIVLLQLEQSGSKVKKGTKIGVVVSAGMESGDIKVPDVTGKNIEEAKKLILQSKLTVGKISYQPTTNVSVNAVIDQYPKGNSMTRENQRVDLFVNKEVKTKIIIEGEEDGLKETKEIDEDLKDKIEYKKDEPKKDEKKKDDKKKDEKKRDDKPKATDKKSDVKREPSDKDKDKKSEKKTNPTTPKDRKDSEKKDEDKKDDGGTKF
ncbi:MAG: PASTA domain-containing protein [Chlorobi bacterium]|nr:PASTA domain-containing protein [Chlorobiota bacterium]MCI0714865.1 PASTA domain-containing protein [Chlorobiota bacterium]